MGKTSSKVKDRYNAKAYDELKIRVPKGRKSTIEEYLKQQGVGVSLNGLVNSLLRAEIGLSEEEWKLVVDDQGGEA